MKYKSIIFSEASGSIAGVTFSHNAGGMYVRARAIPTNPGTPYQSTIRAAFGGLVSLWIETLTQDQRDAWEVYADNVPLRDALGELRYVSGMNHYLRSNTMRLAFGKPRVDDAPVIYDLGYMTAPTFDVDHDTDMVDVGFNELDDWVSEDGAYLMVFASRPQNPTINYFKGPYRYADSIVGSSGSPPSTPNPMVLPFPCGLDQRVFFQAAVTRTDGRRSLDFRNFDLTD